MVLRATHRSAGRAAAMLGATLALATGFAACGSDGKPLRIHAGAAWQLVDAPRVWEPTPRPTPHPTPTPRPTRTTPAPTPTPFNYGDPTSQHPGTIPSTYPPSYWTARNVNPRSKQLRITWTVPTCTTYVRRTLIYVTERPTNVVIDVWQDAVHHDLGKDEGCLLMEISNSDVVKLTGPIGERSLLEHTQPQPPERVYGPTPSPVPQSH